MNTCYFMSCSICGVWQHISQRVLPGHPSMLMVTSLKKANKATLPFLSFAAVSFEVRFIKSPAMETDSLAFV